jgi:acetoacetate decarboxylase
MPKKISRRDLIKASPALGIAALAPNMLAEEAANNGVNPLLTVFPRSESTTPWMMPAHFGMPEWQRLEGVPAGDSLYDDVTLISIDYLTDEEKLISYLPRPFELDGPPVITVAYSMNRDISWLAGGDYNIIAVSARATYPGQVDTVAGNYALVLWENLTDPILPGREQQGVPKVYGEIDDHRAFKGTWRTALSNNGKTMLEMEAADLTKMTPDAFEAFSAKSAQGNLLGWKYIPNETRSAPLLSYGTLFPMSYRYREAWSATGSLQWHPRKWEELPTQAHIVNALHALPIKEILSCTVSKASVTLHASKVRRIS